MALGYNVKQSGSKLFAYKCHLITFANKYDKASGLIWIQTDTLSNCKLILEKISSWQESHEKITQVSQWGKE